MTDTDTEQSQSVQLSLTGDSVDVERTRPNTFMWCPETDQWVLRSLRADWPHNLYASKEDWLDDLNDSSEPDDLGVADGNDDPEQVGSWYDVTIDVSVSYRFRIPAHSKHAAKELAEDWHWDADPGDHHVLHTDIREQSEITTEDVPDDWDPYGNTRLHEVFDDD